jgi:hypothetical protein
VAEALGGGGLFDGGGVVAEALGGGLFDGEGVVADGLTTGDGLCDGFGVSVIGIIVLVSELVGDGDSDGSTVGDSPGSRVGVSGIGEITLFELLVELPDVIDATVGEEGGIDKGAGPLIVMFAESLSVVPFEDEIVGVNSQADPETFA